MRIRTLLLLTTFLSVAGNIVAQQTLGLFYNAATSQDGYVLFSPIMSTNTYLIDKCGKQVHKWTSSSKPGQSVYLLPDGTLLRPESTNNPVFTAGGSGGKISRYDWNSTLLWSHNLSDSMQCQHHDVCALPGGNILAIVWDKKTDTQAISKGRNPAFTSTTVWSEKIVELHPTGTGGATVVWEWYVWDHLNQDFSSSLPGYDTVSRHPELININYAATATTADWLHINSISYNVALDQIMLSVHNFNEIWIIDHSTTTPEAASHSGGAHNKGGDLLYRWGNAAAYNNGTVATKKLFGQHNARWIENGLPDSGKIMIFNNGQGRPGGNYSSVDIIAPPVTTSGDYAYTVGTPYQPDSAMWSYKADTPASFYAVNVSGAQRLSSGGTLICSGPSGTFFEIDSQKHSVWKYVNPVNGAGALAQGTTPAQNITFRCSLYEGSYPGFSGHTLTPGAPIEMNPLTYACPTTGINQLLQETITICVTNPFHEVLQLQATDALSDASITLLGIAGNRIVQWDDIHLGQNAPYSLAIPSELPNGMYILQIRSKNYSNTLTLIKE